MITISLTKKNSRPTETSTMKDFCLANEAFPAMFVPVIKVVKGGFK
jgi:hypothetical protein